MTSAFQVSGLKINSSTMIVLTDTQTEYWVLIPQTLKSNFDEMLSQQKLSHILIERTRISHALWIAMESLRPINFHSVTQGYEKFSWIGNVRG